LESETKIEISDVDKTGKQINNQILIKNLVKEGQETPLGRVSQS